MLQFVDVLTAQWLVRMAKDLNLNRHITLRQIALELLNFLKKTNNSTLQNNNLKAIELFSIPFLFQVNVSLSF